MNGHPADLQLRILYNLNGDSQRFLAKLPSRTTVWVFTSGDVKYASVALKTCLQTLNRCSPELSNGTDYAVYVHDPLETEIPGSDSVAVGMGLLSQALWGPDGLPESVVTVSGKIVRQLDTTEALEIRMGLRVMVRAFLFAKRRVC